MKGYTLQPVCTRQTQKSASNLWPDQQKSAYHYYFVGELVVCLAMAKSLWDKILLKVATDSGISDSKQSPRAVDQAFTCAHCNILIETCSTVYMAHDKAYCNESCRVLGMIPRDVRERVVSKAAKIGLNVPSNDALKPE